MDGDRVNKSCLARTLAKMEVLGEAKAQVVLDESSSQGVLHEEVCAVIERAAKMISESESALQDDLSSCCECFIGESSLDVEPPSTSIPLSHGQRAMLPSKTASSE